MKRAFESVLFDFGGVYIGSPFPAFVREAEHLGIDPTTLIELTFGPMEHDSDHPWHRAERGELDMGRVRKEIIALCAEAGLEIDPFVILARSMAPHSEGHPDVVGCTRELRAAGYRTGLVTNNVLEIRERWRAVLPLDELFDVVVDSSEVGMRKPSPGIYELTLGMLEGTEAERAIFLDDLPANVRAAENLGMRGILVGEDPVTAIAELRILTGLG